MRRIITAVVGITALAIVATSGAVTERSSFVFRGILCRTDTGTETVGCVRKDGVGYVVGINRKAVLVQKTSSRSFVFRRANNGGASKGAVTKGTVLYFHGITCWTDSLVFCARKDAIGYAISISRSTVAVVRLTSPPKGVFYRANR